MTINPRVSFFFSFSFLILCGLLRIALQQLTTLLIVDLPHSFGPDNTPHQGAILPSSTFSDPTLKLSSILTFPLGALLLPLNYIVPWELQQWESLASYGFILTSNIEPTSSSLWQHNELNPSQLCTSSYLQVGRGAGRSHFRNCKMDWLQSTRAKEARDMA